MLIRSVLNSAFPVSTRPSESRPSFGTARQQFWIEHQVWTIVFPDDRFPGDIALQEEINRLRLSRLRTALASEERAKTAASVHNITNDFKQLGSKNWLGRYDNPLCDSEDEDEGADLESVQGEFKVTSRRTQSPKFGESIVEQHFDLLVMHRKRTDFEIDPYCSQHIFKNALKALKEIDPVDRYGHTTFSVRFHADQNIIDALYGYKSDHSDVEWVELQLGVKLRRRFERVRTSDGWIKEYVVRARPTNILDTLSNPEALKLNLVEAFHFLRRWRDLIGGDLRKKKFDGSIQLTTLQRAFVLYKEQKRTEENDSSGQQQVQNRRSLVRKGQNGPRTLADKQINKSKPTVLPQEIHSKAYAANTPNVSTSKSQPRDKLPFSSLPALDTEHWDSVPCPTSARKRRTLSPAQIGHVTKCAKFSYSPA
ncbi:hypothetical protein EG329_009780 [Mollisiaceae sp. DMI_Dod_QoI]|nr:hypothetical protein EG329_009780 [Helotiales sp. DMI_Dod_QoI]